MLVLLGHFWICATICYLVTTSGTRFTFSKRKLFKPSFGLLDLLGGCMHPVPPPCQSSDLQAGLGWMVGWAWGKGCPQKRGSDKKALILDCQSSATSFIVRKNIHVVLVFCTQVKGSKLKGLESRLDKKTKNLDLGLPILSNISTNSALISSNILVQVACV